MTTKNLDSFMFFWIHRYRSGGQRDVEWIHRGALDDDCVLVCHSEEEGNDDEESRRFYVFLDSSLLLRMIKNKNLSTENFFKLSPTQLLQSFVA